MASLFRGIGREPNLLWCKARIGRWTAALTPVPRITARRVEELMYAFARSVEAESLMIDSIRTLKCWESNEPSVLPSFFLDECK